MKPTTFKWKSPQGAEEARERYFLIEDRGDRLLLGTLDPAFDAWVVKPTFVFNKKELTIAKEDKQ